MSPPDDDNQIVSFSLGAFVEMQDVLLEATNCCGKAIHCRVTCAPLFGANKEIYGGVLLMEEWDEARLQRNGEKEE